MTEIMSFMSIGMRFVRGSDDIPYDTVLLSSFSVARKQLMANLPSSDILLGNMSVSSAPYPLFDDVHTVMKDMRTRIVRIE